MSELKEEFTTGLTAKLGFKGYELPKDQVNNTSKFTFQNKEYELKHGSVVIAAITSCTNTSNPDVML